MLPVHTAGFYQGGSKLRGNAHHKNEYHGPAQLTTNSCLRLFEVLRLRQSRTL